MNQLRNLILVCTVVALPSYGQQVDMYGKPIIPGQSIPIVQNPTFGATLPSAQIFANGQCDPNNQSCTQHGIGRSYLPGGLDDSQNGAHFVTEWNTPADFDEDVLNPDGYAANITGDLSDPASTDPYAGEPNEHGRHTSTDQYEIELNGGGAVVRHKGDARGLAAIPGATGCAIPSSAVSCEQVSVTGNNIPQDVYKAAVVNYDVFRLPDASGDYRTTAYATGKGKLEYISHPTLGVMEGSLTNRGDISPQFIVRYSEYEGEPHARGLTPLFSAPIKQYTPQTPSQPNPAVFNPTVAPQFGTSLPLPNTNNTQTTSQGFIVNSGVVVRDQGVYDTGRVTGINTNGLPSNDHVYSDQVATNSQNFSPDEMLGNNSPSVAGQDNSSIYSTDDGFDNGFSGEYENGSDYTPQPENTDSDLTEGDTGVGLASKSYDKYYLAPDKDGYEKLKFITIQDERKAPWVSSVLDAWKWCVLLDRCDDTQKNWKKFELANNHILGNDYSAEFTDVLIPTQRDSTEQFESEFSEENKFYSTLPDFGDTLTINSGTLLWKAIFDEDFQGETLFRHWLAGSGKDQIYINSSTWNDYMKKNKSLSLELQLWILRKMRTTKSSSAISTGYFPMELDDNGYGTGYELLHGTSDFSINGYTLYDVDKNGNGSITYRLQFVWEDELDPNKKYIGDRFYSWLSEATVDPKDYGITISWPTTVVIKVKDGKPQTSGIIGYPFD